MSAGPGKLTAQRKQPWSLGATIERVVNLAEGEGMRALRLFSLIFVMSTALSLLKSAQGGIFLSAYSRKMIPWAFASSALSLTLLSMFAVAMAARIGPVRLAAFSLLGSAFASLALRTLLATSWPGTPFIVYVVLDATNALVVMQTWSVVSGTVDPRSAKRILPMAGVGSSVAWTLSGFLTSRIVAIIGVKGLLILAPMLFCLAAWLVHAVARRDLAAPTRTLPKVSLIEGWRGGFEFVAQVPLMRLCLILGVLALLGEQMMDYQLLSSARERYVEPAAIAVFFARFYGITSAVSLVIQLALSSRILARLGATRGLVITPAATAFFALAVMLVPGFAPIVLLRANDRVLKGALWMSALEQTQTPLPLVRRAQARALSRGVVAPLAYALAALGLAAIPEDTDVRLLSLLIMLVLAVMVGVVIVGLRRAYESALRRAIDDRRLRLDGELTTTTLDREAAEMVARDLSTEDEGKALLAAELLIHAAPAVAEQLLPRGLDHATAAVRVAVLEGLTGVRVAHAEKVAELLAHDPVPEVRRAAVRCLAASRAPGAAVRAAFQLGLADADPEVRAACRVGCVASDDPEATRRGAALIPLLKTEDPELTVAALSALGPRADKNAELFATLRQCLAARNRTTRVATLQALIRIGARELLDDVVPLLADPSTTEDAVSQLFQWDDAALGKAAQKLEVAPWAATAAAGQPEASPRAGLERLLGHRDATVRDRATRALARLVQSGRSKPLPTRDVQTALEHEVAVSFRYLSLLAGVAHDDGTPDWEVAPEYAFLGGELERRFRATCKRVLDLLSLMQSRKLSSVVEAGLRLANSSFHTQMNAQIAELLELALPLELARKVVPLIENLSLRERLNAAERVNLIDQAAIDDPLAFLVALGDAHLRGCAMLIYGARAAARFPEVYKEDEALLLVFERMRFLRSVPLFAEIPGEELRMVAEIVDTVERTEGEIVFRKGDPGEDMYVIVRGRVAIRDGEITIATLGEREFFGELSVIDQEARSADAVILEAAELLRLRAADLGELMARRPQIQEQILLVLVRRLRALNARVAH